MPEYDLEMTSKSQKNLFSKKMKDYNSLFYISYTAFNTIPLLYTYQKKKKKTPY